MSLNDAQGMMCYVTAQMNAKRGLKPFGPAGSNAIMKDLE